MNGSVKWLGIHNFLKNDGPPWTLNILDPYASWGYIGSSTNPNWDIQSGGGSGSVSVPCNCPICVLPVYHQRIFEKHAALHTASVTISFEIIICTSCKVPPLAAISSAVVWLISSMTTEMIYVMIRLINYFSGKFSLVVSVSVNFILFLSLV